MSKWQKKLRVVDKKSIIMHAKHHGIFPKDLNDKTEYEWMKEVPAL